jgi:2-oxoglutarate dehydrogenase E1 component
VSEFVFGTHNAAFVQVMYEQYLRDPTSVADEWKQLFDNGRLAELPLIPFNGAERATPSSPPPATLSSPQPSAPPPPPPAPAPAPAASPSTLSAETLVNLTPMAAAAARLARNMEESLSVPTATSFREVMVRTLDGNRQILNAALEQRGIKLSYTHIIAWALVRAATRLPVMTHAYREIEGKPHRFDPGAVNLGLAVDVERKDGGRALLVPVIKGAERMDFAAFRNSYEALVEKARTGRLLPDDFAGGTITLTNPGTIGTVASVPRLMQGQGSIIATGAIRDVGGARLMTISSTYDHRVIQGAESGVFLRQVDSLLKARTSSTSRSPSN